MGIYKSFYSTIAYKLIEELMLHTYSTKCNVSGSFTPRILLWHNNVGLVSVGPDVECHI